MKYLLMLIRDETQPAPTPNDIEAGYQSHEAFEDWCRAEGIRLVSAHALARNDDARTLRHVDGESVVTDGSATDLREMIAGTYLIDVPDLDAAIRVGKRIPSTNRVEIRPIFPTNWPKE